MYLANTINFPLASKDKFEARFSNFKSFGSFFKSFGSFLSYVSPTIK